MQSAEVIDYARPVRKQAIISPIHAICLLPLILILSPHVYIGLRYLLGHPWPRAGISDPTMDGVPLVIQVGWMFGLLLSTATVLILFFAIFFVRRSRMYFIISFGVFVVTLLWLKADFGGVFFYLSYVPIFLAFNAQVT